MALLLLAVLTSGCTGAMSGEPLTYESEPAAVDGGVADEQGYDLADRETITVDEEADLPFVGERQVVVTNHVTGYSKFEADESAFENASGENVDPDELDEDAAAGALLVVSTPKAEMAGQGLNPLGRAPTRDLVEQFDDRAGEQSDVEYVESTEITVLGTDTEVEKYTTTVETEDGGTHEAFAYVTRVAHGDDYVIAVGVVPKGLDHDEQSLFAMMEGIEHPVADGEG